jgi:ATP-dependent RNA helicase DDX5/DBP2
VNNFLLRMSFERRYDDRNFDRSSFRSGGNHYGGGGDARGGGGHSNSYGGGSGGNGGGAMGKYGGELGSNLKSITWDLSKLPVFEKNFYLEHPDVAQRSEEFSEHWRTSKNITVIGRGIPKVNL